MKRFKMLLGAGLLILCSMVFAFIPSVAEGAVPQLINFQGILRDNAGSPVANGIYSITFTIYDAPTGGANLWTETQSVTTSNGLFTVLLGAVTPVPDSALKDTSRWLGITVAPDPEMTPRQQLVSTGYAYESAQWTSAGQNLFRLSGNVGIGTTNPLYHVDVRDPLAANLTLGNFSRWWSIGGGGGGFSLAENDISGASVRFQIFAGGNTWLVPAGGKVGIGISIAQQKLHVFGSGSNTGIAVDAGFSGRARLGLLPGGVDNGELGFRNDLSIGTISDASLLMTSEKMRITNAGNVGIGTASPARKLEVAGSIKVGASDTVFSSNLASNSPLHLMAGGTTRMLISDANGGVGITTTNPNALLHVVNNNLVNNYVLMENLNAASPSGFWLRSPDRDWLLVQSLGGTTAGSFSIYDQTASAARLHIGTTGNVGVGTTSPEQTFHALKGSAGVVTAHSNSIGIFENSTNGYLSILTPDANERGLLFGEPASATAGGIIYNTLAVPDGFEFRTFNNSVKMVLNNSGNVGIGTTNPQGALDVSSTSGAFIVPRMTTAQRDALTAVNGMIVYNTTTNQFNFRENGAWVTK